MTPPGPDGSRGESYPLSTPAAEARRDGGFPEGLAAATARWRKTATGRRERPPNQAAEDRLRPARWAMLTIAQ